MKTLIAVGLTALSVCAFAEETGPSLFNRICSFLSSSSGETVADAEALKDKSIASLNQQVKDLKAKYESMKSSSSSSEAEALKKKYEELKEELKKKYEDFKAEQKKKYEEAKAKRAAEKKG